MKIITDGPQRTLAEALQDKGILNEEGFIEGEEEKGDFPAPTLAQRRVRPSHPGEILRELYLPATGLTQSEFAARLGVSRHALTQLLHGRRPLTADMAHRLARVLGTSAEFWLKMQRSRDEWDTLHGASSAPKAFKPLPRRAARAKAA